MKTTLRATLIALTIAAAASTTAFGQLTVAAAKPPLSSALQEYFYKQIYNLDRGASTPTDPNRAFAAMDFNNVRTQILQAGTAAFPIAPRVAELLPDSEKNRYTLAYMVMGMTPVSERPAAELVSVADGSNGGAKLVALAQLGRSNARDPVQALLRYTTSQDLAVRLMATVALAYSGKSYPVDVAPALAQALKDPSKEVDLLMQMEMNPEK